MNAMRSPYPGAALLTCVSIALCMQTVRASPAQSSVWIEVSRDAGAVFSGYRLPRAAEGMGVVVLAREIATAAHVVWDAKTITVIDARGNKVAARVERVDQDADIALLSVETELEHAAAIRLRPVVTGERVVAVRWQRSNGTASLAAGSVWATRWTSHGVAVPTILTSIKGQKGMSGGGLFDENGQLVGIVIRIDRTLSYLSTLPVSELCTRFARCAGEFKESR